MVGKATKTSRSWRCRRAGNFLLAGVAAIGCAGLAFANDEPERVRGYFCGSKADQIAFLIERAKGENELMAANAVNKAAGSASCAYFLPLKAIAAEEETVFSGGLAFTVQRFVFLPEKSEHWAGAVFGSLSGGKKGQNI